MCHFLTQNIDPCFPPIAQKKRSIAVPAISGFFGGFWGYAGRRGEWPRASTIVGRLMEMAGVASSFGAGAAADAGAKKRRNKGASGRCGATAAAAAAVAGI